LRSYITSRITSNGGFVIQEGPVFLNLQTFGIDISSYSDDIDWTKLVSLINPRFVFARAYHIGPTQQKTYPDPRFGEYWAKLGTLNLRRGAYLFCDPKADAADSIAKFFSVYTPKKGDLVPTLDIEDNYDSGSGIPVHQRVAQIATMVQLVSQKIGGRMPILYTKKRIWDELGNPSQFANCPLWVLNYFTIPTPHNIPATWPTFAFWQYAENVKYESIFKGDYDLNFFNDVESELDKFTVP
jgi:lysozyme